MENFTKEYLENIVPERIFWRGEDLYNEEALKQVDISNNRITAKVLGSRLYTVKAELIDNSYFFSCTCPYDGFCKHEVALGLWMIEHKKATLKMAKEQDTDASQQDIDIEVLVKKATGEQKDKFLSEALKEFPILLNRFEVMLKGAENLGSEVDIDRLGKEIRKKMEAFDLTDYTRFYESAPESYGYREEWQVLQDGAEAEFEELIEQYTIKAGELLSSRNVLGSFKYILAVYEAIKTVDFRDFKDPACIFEVDGLYYLTDTILVQILNEFRSGFSDLSFEENVYKNIINILFERVNKNRKKQIYNLSDFSELLQRCIQNPNTASYLHENLKRISQLPEEDYCEVLLAVYDKLGDKKNWLELAEKYYKTNRNVAEKLFVHFAGDKAKLIQLANEAAFLFDKKFIPFFYEHLTKEDNPVLYQKILREHVRKSQTLKLYKEYKRKYGADAAREFINSLEGQWNTEKFFISLLIEEKAYEKLLSLAKQKSVRYPEMAYLRPIVNIYPEAVYKIISACSERFLEENLGREYYRQAAEWLKLLKKIEDKNVHQKADSYLNRLIEKYNNRPAMKDEFRKAKLI